MNKHLLSQYASLDAQFKELELKKAHLRGLILKDLMDNNLDKVQSENLGTFTVCEKKIWQYTPAITTLEEKLKIARIKEQDRGTAKSITSEYLLFKPTV